MMQEEGGGVVMLMQAIVIDWMLTSARAGAGTAHVPLNHITVRPPIDYAENWKKKKEGFPLFCQALTSSSLLSRTLFSKGQHHGIRMYCGGWLPE